MVNRDAIRGYAANPFTGFPAGHRYADDVTDGGLLDIMAARTWFDRIDASRDANAYTFGLPLDTRAAATSGFAGQELTVFSTYGYLGLNGHPRITAAAAEAVERWGTSTGGVRLLTGTIQLHLDTERDLAAYLGTQASALFANGYDANVAAISGVVGRRDVAILDEKAHRSVFDGCRLAGCRVVKFRHNDMTHLDSLLAEHTGGAGRVLVAVDGVYSMDGDLAPLEDLVRLKHRYGAFLLLDESHAIGVIGKDGRGTASHAGVMPAEVDIMTGSLGKAFPSGGGFVAGSRGLIMYLQHGTAPYMFSSALTPANTAAIREAIRVVVEEPEHRERMDVNTARLRAIVAGAGLDHGPTATPIVPVILGDTLRTYAWARRLLDFGIYTSAVPAPAVPEGQSRLRLCATAGHTADDLDRLEQALRTIRAGEAAQARSRSRDRADDQ
ncbi:pyridoxal phosphate-dependent aminotransferase family protein [Actinoplanes bogorensis]|uniref:8-amino-7-oxononanoate synthase n=1 Tax=Paractinoplanes bogorensis TaxID=1610840 RepID=A0ABS5YRZ8_9ACTN|nr:pyridoxal phosphate-dependent aminotransferase family protein [Actinoplanes bogorensis]MBU2666223.1 pyridoxal phosphate-dependent aminotransferase family protein [Actinoplanes bogorensis]